jgi:catechol 2,3-dioxygenase-like lactoylglutathione lyase family enzyme
MKELKDFAGSIAILVSSCDAFFDVWRPFAFFFRKYWGDCPFPVYLIVNQLRIRSEFIEAIAVGEDRGWASNMKLALEKIDAPRVLYLQEDYFLNGPVRAEKLAADGIKLDEPPRTNPQGGNTITYITDPWGTRIEIIERAPVGPVVQQ